MSSVPAIIVASVPQASSDRDLVDLWLATHRSAETVRAYRHDIDTALDALQKPLQSVTLRDLLDYSATLHGAPASVARRLSAVKSLWAFAHRIGYVQMDVAAAVPVSTVRNGLAERILSREDVLHMLESEPDPRDRIMLRLAYLSGLRVSELSELRWLHVLPRDNGVQLSVLGKGGKTRQVLVPMGAPLMELRGDAGPNDFVFRSRKTGGAICPMQIRRIVKDAAIRAGLPNKVSPHWLRHANASHALDNKCPVHVVQQSLGHASLATTTRYVHARPDDGSGMYLTGS